MRGGLILTAMWPLLTPQKKIKISLLSLKSADDDALEDDYDDLRDDMVDDVFNDEGGVMNKASTRHEQQLT